MKTWDMTVLAAAPEVEKAAASGEAGVHSIFYEGLPWRGKPTRVFAYYGIPETKAGVRVPGMVLVHGGGGSAFIPWVKLWMSRGYAALAMDTCGCVSGNGNGAHPRHERGGPPGWGGFDRVDEPIEDQWTYQAVADVILGHSLLRSFPQVDSEKIGLTGVSWGGYLTCIAAAIDSRFSFAAPVYGCGFLGENSVWLDEFKKMGAARSARWLSLWDPSVYLPRVRLPMVWVTGTNDFAYPLDSWLKSTRLPAGPRTLCLRVRMPHGHGGPGENPPEIYAMAESLFRGGAPLARITKTGCEGRLFQASFESQSPVVNAELNVTTDSGPWLQREWQTIPAELNARTGTASVCVPDSSTCHYLNLIDDRGCVVSSEPVSTRAAE